MSVRHEPHAVVEQAANEKGNRMRQRQTRLWTGERDASGWTDPRPWNMGSVNPKIFWNTFWTL